MVDGSIKYQETEGSIHKIAAKILGAESCNGWTYWYYKSGNSLKSIDELRQRLRLIINFYKFYLGNFLQNFLFFTNNFKTIFLKKIAIGFDK